MGKMIEYISFMNSLFTHIFNLKDIDDNMERVKSKGMETLQNLIKILSCMYLNAVNSCVY